MAEDAGTAIHVREVIGQENDGDDNQDSAQHSRENTCCKMKKNTGCKILIGIDTISLLIWLATFVITTSIMMFRIGEIARLFGIGFLWTFIIHPGRYFGPGQELHYSKYLKIVGSIELFLVTLNICLPHFISNSELHSVMKLLRLTRVIYLLNIAATITLLICEIRHIDSSINIVNMDENDELV